MTIPMLKMKEMPSNLLILVTLTLNLSLMVAVSAVKTKADSIS